MSHACVLFCGTTRCRPEFCDNRQRLEVKLHGSHDQLLLAAAPAAAAEAVAVLCVVEVLR